MNPKLDQDSRQKYQQPQKCRWYRCNGRKWRRTKENLKRVKEKSEKTGLKLSIQKTKITGSSSINSVQVSCSVMSNSLQPQGLQICQASLSITIQHFMANGRRKVEAATCFIFLGSKINVDVDCSHDIKIHLLLGRKAMTNLENVSKNRDITLLMRVLYSQRCGFSNSYV